MKHYSENPVTALVDHLAECTDAKAAIVVDGNADGVVSSLVAGGWELSDRVEYVNGKRIRYVSIPVGNV